MATEAPGIAAFARTLSSAPWSRSVGMAGGALGDGDGDAVGDGAWPGPEGVADAPPTAVEGAAGGALPLARATGEADDPKPPPATPMSIAATATSATSTAATRVGDAAGRVDPRACAGFGMMVRRYARLRAHRARQPPPLLVVQT
jgi:hypothetical protein